MNINVTAGLTVGSEERRREEAFVHQTRERNNADHVVGVKGQAAERLAAQLLWEKNRRILTFKGGEGKGWHGSRNNGRTASLRPTT